MIGISKFPNPLKELAIFIKKLELKLNKIKK